jgi:hypothetical protein
MPPAEKGINPHATKLRVITAGGVKINKMLTLNLGAINSLTANFNPSATG